MRAVGRDGLLDRCFRYAGWATIITKLRQGCRVPPAKRKSTYWQAVRNICVRQKLWHFDTLARLVADQSDAALRVPRSSSNATNISKLDRFLTISHKTRVGERSVMGGI